MPPKKPIKQRLDKILVDQGLCSSRTQAQSLIMAGHVLIQNQVVDKPGALFPESIEVRLKESLRYVSRGGLKLEKALDTFAVSVTGKSCLDVGASTGGFTDCLLQHGASHVVAVDVGYGQLDWKLRQDSRVSLFEKTHILHFTTQQWPGSFDLGVIDVSFISLKKVLPHVTTLLIGTASDNSNPRDIICLVKPQFEYLDYCEIKGFRGVVTDPNDLVTILQALGNDLKPLLPQWELTGITESPIQGPKGNREFLYHLHYTPSALSKQPPPKRDILEDVTTLVFKHSLQSSE